MQVRTDTAFIEGLAADGTLLTVTYNVPTHYTVGVGYTTMVEAVEVAAERVRKAVMRHNDFYGEGNPATLVPLPETMSVDLRWVWKRADGSSIDAAVVRYTFDNIADAEAWLEAHR